MSKKPAAIPFFGDAYLADTTHLTTEEHGAYFLLLLAAWRQDDCALPDNDKKLARIAGVSAQKWRSIKPTLMDFWKVENGRIFQPRLRKERAWVNKKSDTSSKSARARWDKQAPENKEDGGMQTHSERNAPPPPPLPLSNDNGADRDPSKVFWDGAKGYLGKSKGGLIGKWAKTYGQATVAEAITEAMLVSPQPADRVAYVGGILRKSKNSAGEVW